jgi:methylthioribulose-1-phosphate dehydratase
LSGTCTTSEYICEAGDIAALEKKLAAALATEESPPRGFLIHRDGLYTWGEDLDQARRHAEALEFLLEVFGRRP